MKQVLRWLSARNLRFAVIAAPLLVAALYLWLAAADRYVAESVVAVRDSERLPGLDGLATLFGGGGNTGRQDLLLLRAHIASIDMLRQVDNKLGLRKNFSAPAADLVFRLPASASQESFLAYYRNRIELVYDDQASLLRVRTEAFTPEVAYAMNREVVQLSERFINETSHQLARDQMNFAETELDKARARMAKAKLALLEFQNKHGVLDPVAQAQANTGLTAELQSTLARQEAELKGLTGYLNDEAYQVKSLRTQIAGVRDQLEAESRRAMSTKNGTQLNALAGDYQGLLGDLQFAQDGYKLGLTALETARIESTRKLKSLVLVESPAKPDAPENPRRLYLLSALLVGLGLLYGIVRLVVATIEDHQE